MRKKLKKLLEEFEACVRAHECRGGCEPASIIEIDADYEKAKRELHEHLKENYAFKVPK